MRDGYGGSVGQVAGATPEGVARRLEQGVVLEGVRLNELLRQILPDEIKAAIDRLSDDFREIVVLRDIQGFSYREIADLLRIPIGTVMSRLYRARHLLQEDLSRYGMEHGYVRAEAVVVPRNA